MGNSIYINMSRQSGLLKELESIANNIANADTAGFKREGAVFTEYIARLDQQEPSVSIGRLGGHYGSFEQGGLQQTGGSLDVAIEGEGFFLIGTPAGDRLSRAGHFMTTSEGTLVNSDGYRVLDSSGGDIQIPLEAGTIAIAGDGTISADGQPLGRIGVVNARPETMERMGANLWNAREGYEAVEETKVVQGFVERSNVNPVNEIVRLIEVQRQYETGQKIFDREDERITSVIQTIRRG